MPVAQRCQFSLQSQVGFEVRAREELHELPFEFGLVRAEQQVALLLAGQEIVRVSAQHRDCELELLGSSGGIRPSK